MYKRKNINEIVNETIEQFGKVKVIPKLDERIAELGLSLTELSHLTGIRYASLNELKNGKKVTLNLQHLLAIMVALRINSFDELFELQFEDNRKTEQFNEEVEQYAEYGMPDSDLEKIKGNKARMEEMYKKKH